MKWKINVHKMRRGVQELHKGFSILFYASTKNVSRLLISLSHKKIKERHEKLKRKCFFEIITVNFV